MELLLEDVAILNNIWTARIINVNNLSNRLGAENDLLPSDIARIVNSLAGLKLVEILLNDELEAIVHVTTAGQKAMISGEI